MDPLLHFISLQMSRTLEDSPEVARRREFLHEHRLATHTRRAYRRRERARQAVALVTRRGRRWHRELAGKAA